MTKLPYPVAVKTRVLGVLVLSLVTILVYFNSLKGSPVFDDFNYLHAPWTQNIHQFREMVNLADIGVRPILLFTFAANNTLHGNNALGFHLINLLLHALVTILIFHILCRSKYFLTGTQNHPADEWVASPAFPLIPALLFALHPLNTESVSYLSSRSSLLATFFYLLTLYGFLLIFSRDGSGSKKAIRATLGVFCLFGFYLSIASKLIGATLPVMLAIWFLVLICPRRFPRLLPRLLDKKTLALSLAGTLAVAGVVLLGIPDHYWNPLDQGVFLFGRVPYFFVQAKVIIFYYLKMFLIPINLNIDIGFPFSAPGTDKKIALSLLLIGAILWYALKTKSRVLILGTLWFFITLLPTSSVIPLNDLAVEHRTYLPMTLGLGVVFAWFITRIPRAGQLPFLMFIFITLSSMTLARNPVWIDSIHLWKDAVRKNPNSPRPQNNLGKAHYDQAAKEFAAGNAVRAIGERDLALKHFRLSLASLSRYAATHFNEPQLVRYIDKLAAPNLKEQLDRASALAPSIQENGATAGKNPKKSLSPEKVREILKNSNVLANFSEPHYNLASLYLDLEQYRNAAHEYSIALQINPAYFAAYLGLGSVYNLMGQHDRAIRLFREAVEKKKQATGSPDYPLARLNLGEIYGKTGRFSEAIVELKQAVRYAPKLDKAHFNLGVVYMKTGDLDKAEQAYRTCLKINGGFLEARFNLAHLYQLKKEWSNSTLQMEKLLKTHGPNPEAYFQIAWNQQQLKRFDKAREFYQLALTLAPGLVSARINLGSIYIQEKDFPSAIAAFELAARYQPEDFKIHRQLGLLYLQTGGNKPRARDHLQTALSLSPSETETSQIRELIKELPSP